MAQICSFFFFSSRRRHTRCYRDWSSDVCSSDLELAPRVLTGFVDGEVNRLLGLDAAREVALELVVVGHETSIAPPGGALEAIDHPTLPLSSSEVDYPLVREIHTASSLSTPGAVRAWRLQGGAGARGMAAETTLAATRDVGSASPTARADPENTG